MGTVAKKNEYQHSSLAEIKPLSSIPHAALTASHAPQLWIQYGAHLVPVVSFTDTAKPTPILHDERLTWELSLDHTYRLLLNQLQMWEVQKHSCPVDW